ncbi:hypothetical protein GCM10023088_16340 [Actinomadura verrucosospora]|uniref:hypothetical protein n=1 Tax=Actinomadura verrucosospora TaxID=46165 RepID=UPI0031E92C0B
MSLAGRTVLRDQHVFYFPNTAHLTDYLLTGPKYQPAAERRGEPVALQGSWNRLADDGTVQP